MKVLLLTKTKLDWSFTGRQTHHEAENQQLSKWNTGDMLPWLWASSALASALIQEPVTSPQEGATLGGGGRHWSWIGRLRRRAASCISMQTRHVGLSPPESYLSSLPDTPVSQPVQHSSAFIFISRGAPSCHRPGESATRISAYACKALTQTHGTQEVPLWKFATFIVLLMLHCHRTHAHTTVSFGNFNIKGFKCQIFTSIIHRQRINSLKTLYPQRDDWLCRLSALAQLSRRR